MQYLRLFRYPGAKTSVLPEICQSFDHSSASRFVDVFGGSGTVALNVMASRTVYNDISPNMVNIFLVLRDSPCTLIEFFRRFLNEVEERSGSDDPKDYNRCIRLHGTRIMDNLFREWTSGGRSKSPADNSEKKNSSLENAFRTIYEHSVSFGGMGETYATVREKSVYRYLAKTESVLKKAAERIEEWEIETMDFRDLVTKYDDAHTFFYFDPPFPGKDWYNYEFTLKEFSDLGTVMKSLKGKYLMTLDAADQALADIFGEPSYTRTYRNMNGKGAGREPLRRKAFYTNVTR